MQKLKTKKARIDIEKQE